MVSSRVYPGLERAPGPRDNWVEATGQLPSYIERIAKHLHYEQGYTISRAIATAINTVKRWARGGTVRANGGHRVTPKTQAQAAKALAEWTALKARNRARTAARDHTAPTGERGDVVDLVKPADKLTEAERRRVPTRPGDTSFPIRNRMDLLKAIRSVGRTPAPKRAPTRRYIMRRARQLGASAMIPRSWNADGTINLTQDGAAALSRVDLARPRPTGAQNYYAYQGRVGSGNVLGRRSKRRLRRRYLLPFIDRTPKTRGLNTVSAPIRDFRRRTRHIGPRLPI